MKPRLSFRIQPSERTVRVDTLRLRVSGTTPAAGKRLATAVAAGLAAEAANIGPVGSDPVKVRIVSPTAGDGLAGTIVNGVRTALRGDRGRR